MRAAIGFVVLLAVVLTSSQEDAVEQKALETPETQETAETSETSSKQRDDKLLKLYVGYYSQTTLLHILTRTTTAIYTCISTTATMAACSGRRRRSLIEDTDLEAEGLDEVDPTALEGSQDQKLLQHPVEVNDRDGRKVTMWTSVYSTLEVLTTIFNGGTTLTASAICNIVNGMTIGNSCFG